MEREQIVNFYTRLLLGDPLVKEELKMVIEEAGKRVSMKDELEELLISKGFSAEEAAQAALEWREKHEG